jgi:hypothetical protein
MEIWFSSIRNDLATKEGIQVVNPESFKDNIIKAVQHARQFSEDIYLVSVLPVSKNIDGIVVSSGN